MPTATRHPKTAILDPSLAVASEGAEDDDGDADSDADGDAAPKDSNP